LHRTYEGLKRGCGHLWPPSSKVVCTVPMRV